MRYLNSIYTKLLVAFLVVVLVPLIGTGLYGNWITSQIIGQRAIESARNDVRLRAEEVAGFLDRTRGDVLYLAHLEALQQLIKVRAANDETEIEPWRTQVTRDFLIFSAARPMYYQVRYLDEAGQEMVRIDSDSEVSHIIRPADLQNKAHRYYFAETMKLPPGGIYVSPLDLNQEQGLIEVPYTPVIRYATPVFDDQGKRRGIVIINVFADHFLEFVQESEVEDSQHILVDQDGYYLAHPDVDLLWGGPNDLGTGKSVWGDYPENAAGILSGAEGDFIARKRVVVYTPLYPVRSARDHYWVILLDESTPSLFAPIKTFRITAVSILALAVLVAMAMAVVLSRQLTSPILRLREGVSRFSQGKLDQSIPVQTDDEIGQLTAAFNEMAAVINHHLEQLDTLNKAGRRISSGLERRTTLRAILEATQALFSAEYCAITLMQSGATELPAPITEVGDSAWDSQRKTAIVRQVSRRVLEESVSLGTQLEEMDGYFCCAPLRLGPDKQGLIELYGRDPTLTSQTCKNLLFTLAVEASIALENVDLYEALTDHKRQLEKLVEQLINAQEAERKFVAYDMHDGLIQYLVGARLQLSKFAMLIENQSPETETALTEAMANLTRAVQEGRRVIEGLRPTLLDNLGLGPALRELARDMDQVTGWKVVFNNQLGDTRLPSTVELTAFRIAQEALTNARKHAGTTRIDLTLRCKNGWLDISIQDYGHGFDANHAANRQRCFGLVSMRERAALLGGTCAITSQLGRGTAVMARLPLATRD